MKKRDVLYHLNICAWMLWAFLPIFSACNKVEDEFVFGDEVRLTASLAPALSTVYTKGEGEIKSTHAGELTIGVAKTFTTAGNFNFNDAQNTTGLRAVMGAPSASNLGLRDIRFDDFQGFPDASTQMNYIAWYPYDGATYANPDTGNTTVSFDIPTDASTDILYSDVASGTRLSGFNTMTFRHALVKYTIKVYAMESDETAGSVSDVWGKIQSVTLEDMPSTCVLNLPTASERVSDVSFAGGPVSLHRDAPSSFGKIPVGFSKAADLTYFLAPPPLNDENVLKIKVITEKSQNGKNAETSIARNFQPGKHYQIYLRFTTHGIISAEVVAGEWIDSGEFLHVDSNVGLFYDLSESHTANSYQVAAAYNYCFDATVRGNGYTGVAAIPGASMDIYKLGSPVKAEVVWTDLVSGPDENLDEIITLVPNVVEDHVFFHVHPRVPGGHALKKEGNVVIGVRDASGNMLWTWHIWLTDRPAEQGYKNGFAVQDRDLGATSYNAETEPDGINGLYYQWGRPTPLPLGKTVYAPVYDEDGFWIRNEVVNFTYDQTNSPNIIARVETPTAFYAAKATASEGTLTKSLWGWRTETDEYAKTIYDPCPPGYRVPSIKLWRELVIEDENGDGKHDAHIVGNNIAAKFKVDKNHTEVYYPMTGYYTSLTENARMNIGAYMWAATFELGNLNDLSDDAPYGLGFRLDTENSNNELNEMTKEPVPSNIAMPVRCISRMSKAHITDLSSYQTANSYVISKEGYYKFKATIRGNGIGQLVSPGSTSTIVLTEQLQTVDIKNQLVNVEPLWWMPAAGSSVTSPKFAMQNGGAPDAEGYVTFELETFNEGNLILAGYDAKGEIVWSWHLWFTDEPQMKKSNSFVVMDRYLGATYAPTPSTEPTGTLLDETYGFYYQWGRKDPFPKPSAGAVIYKYNGGVYSEMPVSYPSPESTGNTAFKTHGTEATKTVEHSVKNPMTYHLASDWSSSQGDELVYTYQYGNYYYLYTNVLSSCNESRYQCFSNMLYPSNRGALWGYSALSNTYGVTTTKTMYDPCPPGYVVSYYLVWTNTERNTNSNVCYYTNLDSGFKAHGLTSGSYGLFLNNGLTSSDARYNLFEQTWYPYSGFMSGKDASLKSDGYYGIGIFHTSTPAGQSSRSIAYSRSQSGQAIEGSSYGLPSTFAYPVRCQKE